MGAAGVSAAGGGAGFLMEPWPLRWAIVGFAVAAALTVVCGVRLAAYGDALADRTGWGEALFGAVLFGMATSLSGIVMTGASAATAHPQLAYSNAVGGIAVQTLAIVVADAAYRQANLEHAAASAQNLLFGCLLIVLLATALLGTFGPAITVFGVHPISAIMVAFYLGGLALIRDTRQPMWRAVPTTDTRHDEPGGHGRLSRHGPARLWASFGAVAIAVAVGGWVVARSAVTIVVATGLSAGFVGAVLMGIVNALPETVTAFAAVRRGAVTLAVAAIIGGNSLDVLNLVVGDIAFRAGSLYHAAGVDALFLTTTALLMTAVLLGGLLVRQRRGWWRLGFDGILLVLLYLAAVVVLAR